MTTRVYDRSNLNPKGTPEDKTRCIQTVCPKPYWHMPQCSRKRGFGPNGEYCKQHAKKLEYLASLVADKQTGEKQ